MQQHKEHLKCDFTDTEIADFARQLARANQSRSAIEQQKKEVDSQLKAEIECQITIINRLSGLVQTGSEYRSVECRVELDTPESGLKRIVRLDTGEQVKITPMTDADRQMALELQEQANAADEQERVIVTEPPVLKRLEAPEINGTVEASPFEQDSVKKRSRRPRVDAEDFAAPVEVAAE